MKRRRGKIVDGVEFVPAPATPNYIGDDLSEEKPVEWIPLEEAKKRYPNNRRFKE